MSQITFLYNNAELAFAAYANLQTGNTNSEANITALEQADMSNKQATEFAARYPEVVTQFNDTESSFSATVFKDVSGNLTLAIRGTLELGDFIPTDTDIALRGAAYDQIIAMYNWWTRVSTPAGEMVPQYNFAFHDSTEPQPPTSIKLYSINTFDNMGQPMTQDVYLELAPAVLSSGELVDDLAADPDQQLDVTGHSLGAHLSLAFNSLFPDVTNEVMGFDTPGFKDTSINQQFFAALGGTVPVADNSGNVVNVIADESAVGDAPWNAVAGLHFDGNPTGEIVNIAIENQFLSDEPDPAGARNHSQQILTDALAVFNLLAQLDPSLSVSAYKSILNAATIGTAASYERIVDALEVLLDINTETLPSGNSNRNALYEAIFAVREKILLNPASLAPELKPEFLSLMITPLNALTSELKLKAEGEPLVLDNPEDAIAYRYALRELNPFVITGNAAIYAPHNENGELELENFSDQYLEDRACFLALKITLGLQDRATLQQASESTRFIDNASGLELATNSARGGLDKQFIFGTDHSEGREAFETSNVADHVFGGGGIDTVFGGGAMIKSMAARTTITLKARPRMILLRMLVLIGY